MRFRASDNPSNVILNFFAQSSRDSARACEINQRSVEISRGGRHGCSIQCCLSAESQWRWSTTSFILNCPPDPRLRASEAPPAAPQATPSAPELAPVWREPDTARLATARPGSDTFTNPPLNKIVLYQLKLSCSILYQDGGEHGDKKGTCSGDAVGQTTDARGGCGQNAN